MLYLNGTGKSSVDVGCHGLKKKEFPMFNLGDRVVYPGHGVAHINQVIKKVIGGQVTTFYELKFINKDMTILIPTTGSSTIGVRPLSSSDSINDIFSFLAQSVKKIKSSEVIINWKQRNKEYQSKLRTGKLKDISEIYRELKHIEQYKELSFCEKSLLQQTESLLVEEIALVKKFGPEKAVEYLRSIFNPHQGASMVMQKAL